MVTASGHPLGFLQRLVHWPVGGFRCPTRKEILGKWRPLNSVNLIGCLLGWRGGATVGRWTCDQEVVGSIPGSGRSCVTTVGKSITPACLDADSLRYYTFTFGCLFLSAVDRSPMSCEATQTLLVGRPTYSHLTWGSKSANIRSTEPSKRSTELSHGRLSVRTRLHGRGVNWMQMRGD